jgi:hypothetical protein
MGTGAGRSSDGFDGMLPGRGSGFTRGGAGTVGGPVGVVVVGTGVVGPGFDEAPGFPAGGSGVVLFAGGEVPPPGMLNGADTGAFCDDVPFDPCEELGFRRE